MGSVDTTIFEFISRLKKRDLPKPTEENKPDLKGSAPIFNFGEVKNLAIITTNENDHSLTSKYVDIGGEMIGLDETDFRLLKEHLEPLLDIPQFSRYADIAFLVDKTFDWLLLVRQLQKAEQSLTVYLNEQLEQTVKEYHFFYRIQPLSIEEKFEIGGGEIGYFTEEMIKDYYQDFSKIKPETSFEEFRELYKDHFTGIHVRIKIKAVPERAESLARRKAEQIVDVLKCFCAKYATQEYFQVFDLDYRLTGTGVALVMRLADAKINGSDLLLRNKTRVIPIELSKKELEEFYALGLKEFSDFLLNNQKNELTDLIEGGINLLASIASTHNSYEKVVKIISFIENIVVSKEGSGKAKGQTKVRKLIPQIISRQKDVELITEAFARGYAIRDKYLHNYIQLPLERETLFYLMEFERAVLLKLIRLCKKFTTISEIHRYFNIQ